MDDKKTKNKKDLLKQLSQSVKDEPAKRSRGPVNLGTGSTIGNTPSQETPATTIDFSYKVEQEKNEVYFYNKSEGEGLDLEWDFGNGSTYEGDEPGKVNYEEPGKYTVILTDRNSGTTKEKSFKLKDTSLSPPIKEKTPAPMATTNKLTDILDTARKEEFMMTMNNVRLDKTVHSVFSRLTSDNGTITNLSNYILKKFISEHRDEIKKHIEQLNQVEF